MVLGRINQIRGGSALVHVLGVWAEGLIQHAAPTSVAAASPPLVAVLHGTRARPDGEVVFGGVDGTVRLPPWAVEGATLVAVVVSASSVDASPFRFGSPMYCRTTTRTARGRYRGCTKSRAATVPMVESLSPMAVRSAAPWPIWRQLWRGRRQQRQRRRRQQQQEEG